MDTDGYCGGQGGTQFGSSSKQMSQDVVDIVRSLGGIAKMTRKETTHRPAWLVYIQPGRKFNPFWLKRKAEKITTKHAQKAFSAFGEN